MLQIDWPWVLLMLPLPLVVYFCLPARPTEQDAALQVPFLNDFRFPEASTRRPLKSRWVKYLSLLAWCLLVVAGSRPEWLGEPISINISGRDLMMAVDLSGSMETEDFYIGNNRVDRLTATKAVMEGFIENRKGDRLGLILFGDKAYLQTPLTFDIKTVNQLLKESSIGLAGEKTAIGDAIGLALKKLPKNSQLSQVLILVTDGANTAGEITPTKAAELAAEKGLKIYTIGIGADEITVKTWFGTQKTNPSADLDEETLQAIADITGGRYFRAHDTKQMTEIYALLDLLEPVDQDNEELRPIYSLFHWPLALALCLGFILCLNRR